MKVTSAHFNPKIQPYLRHNDRTNTKSPNIHQDLMHLNEYTKSSSEVLKEIDKLYKEAMQKLKGTKGKRTPKERSYHEAIFEIAEDTTMEQCKELADKICKLTGFRTLQIAIHRDEGHTDLEGNFKTHYHAHAVFFTLDKDTGKQLARQEASLTKYNLSKIQDLASEIFNLQRGEKGSKKQYISDYREYKKIQEAKQKLVKTEQELALKSFKINKAIENIEIETKWITEQKEELKKQEKILREKKLAILEKAEDAHQALIGTYKKRYSFFKNIITLGKHQKDLQDEFERAENFLMSQTERAMKEADKKNNELKEQLQSAINLINTYATEKEELLKQLRKEQEEKEEAKFKIKELKEIIQELKNKYEPEKTIQHTQQKTQNKTRDYGYSR